MEFGRGTARGRKGKGIEKGEWATIFKYPPEAHKKKNLKNKRALLLSRKGGCVKLTDETLKIILSRLSPVNHAAHAVCTPDSHRGDQMPPSPATVSSSGTRPWSLGRSRVEVGRGREAPGGRGESGVGAEG